MIFPARQAMKEVTGPIVATAPVLCAVLLKDHRAPKDWLARVMEKPRAWFFTPFNRVFAWAGERYSASVGNVLRKSAVAFPGLSINGFSVASNAGITFLTLKPFEERTTPELSGKAIAVARNKQFAGIQDAFILTVPPPPVHGLGTIGGFKLSVEDRADLGCDALYQNVQNVIGTGNQTPGLAGVFSTFTVNVPQLDANIDREKAKLQGVPLQNLFETMQIHLGSLYVNDFNRFGRANEVVAQADAPFRAHADDITRLKTRNDKGKMVSFGAIVKVTESHGPDRVMRYNGYPAAEINGAPAPGYCSGQAEAAMTRLVNENLPRGMTYEWTELACQRILAGDAAIYVYPLCLLFAITGVWLKGSDNNIFTQIGLIVLAASRVRTPCSSSSSPRSNRTKA